MTVNNQTHLLVQLATTSDQAGGDQSGANHHATAFGSGELPKAVLLKERTAIRFGGGEHGSSYLQLPSNVLSKVNDDTGLTVASWIYLEPGQSVWERIFDFGEGPQGPYLFLTRNLRGVCFNGSDLAVDYNKQLPVGEWFHVALVVSGTKGATESKAGPRLYLNGQLIVDGSISQTSSGTYLAYRQWWATLEGNGYHSNYIGRSQFAADRDFNGAISDFRIYAVALTDQQVVELMCETLCDEQIVAIASQTDIKLPAAIITESLELSDSLLNGLVALNWSSSHPEVLSHQGVVNEVITEPHAITLTAALSRGEARFSISYELTVLPKSVVPYEIVLNPQGKSAAVSPVMYGLFYEDINNAADGGIYAELVRNRSFEAFTFDSFSHVCGEHGHSTGRKRNPLEGWYGDTDAITVQDTGGLNEYFGLEDAEVNNTYIAAPAGTTLINKGFNDSNHHCAMSFIEGETYSFTIWAKATSSSALHIQLQNPQGEAISESLKLELEADGKWRKYGISSPLVLAAKQTVLGQLAITFAGEASIDMVSLFPNKVWGATEEEGSPSAHRNYIGNRNYRLRRDMVVALQNMKPTFLRFPGGCISEGSHVWENVYDWKQSVGDVEVRKENFNVWGYMMTLGLGYMEYFQLAEDLNATPLPVMACGVLCQARSDYANPAGGALRDYYIKNFTDLIDFAISEDIAGNEWAKLRASMGHPAPFDLRYLGVGNENWGTEFFANFEVFKVAIERYMEEHYPGRELTIISTVGAQADDIAYEQGWKFLRGQYKGSETIAFTDGCNRIEETVQWYSEQSNYMDTIVDEHYYRSNDYLLRNADRYNYYFRAYDEQGKLDEKLTSKVFVGEYASNDKNTLAGAIAEAAVMTGFENNADVVRLAAYAPLFNKVLTDGSYRWTPDCIWFDDTDIWFTPNYYVQAMFANHLGTQTVASDYYTYRNGEKIRLKPEGGISLSTANGHVVLKSVVVRTQNGELLFEQDFTEELNEQWKWLEGSDRSMWQKGVGVTLQSSGGKRKGLYLDARWSQVQVEVVAHHVTGDDGLYIGVGLQHANSSKQDVIEYVAGENGKATGIKVFKQGVEAYTLGDFAASTMAGNMRAAYDERLEENSTYCYKVNYGGEYGDELRCQHRALYDEELRFDFTYKLEAYHEELFYSITRDDKRLYMKLVNADAIRKSVAIDTAQLQVREQFECTVLTGDEALLHTPNVNKKNAELVVPRQSKQQAVNGKALLELPPHSVQVIVWELEA
ncbi:alpha-L-arabinofuranosidase C-terminal domain-containing protein [Paenibacillus septentrionalis]|uniref:non-reducing end alpha-L-arabinofuranosidase n=1 Tax=Paenibacillus septentrionalis TaxID=429342 RepID=A0ABW1V8G2_9BACL